ncbi:MAG: ATP-dependent Clp protease adaptor ClpS [Rhodothermales bacterium]
MTSPFDQMLAVPLPPVYGMVPVALETDAPPAEKEIEQEEELVLLIPQYHVVLLDDDEHTYEYVIEMLIQLFGHSFATAYQMACEVDSAGRVIVDTTTRERAELKRDQIHGYGPDWRIPYCQGSMSALVEPVE